MKILNVNPRSGSRGAALILDIIIYLVIVALIAVAVTSGVRAVRDLVFTSHGKGDLQNIAAWTEGRYAEDGEYTYAYISAPFNDQPTLTGANGTTNVGVVVVSNGANAGWCAKIKIYSISDRSKSNIWITSNNPSRYMQSGTSSHPGGEGAQYPPTMAQTGAPVGCPAWTDY